ncbi:ERVV2 protein, partial [Atrichornis clamosus]|nr:ERVV2 protein [Atrichornis clamosus]
TTFCGEIRALIPSLEAIELEKAIVDISAVIEHIENQISDAIMALQEVVQGLSRMILKNRMALDFLVASQEGVCTVINTSCCSYIDQSGRINKDLA